MVVCGHETLEEKFIFQIGTLTPHGINERFLLTNLFLRDARS